MKKKVVAFVPIKLNSQRLKNKNILPIKGKPLSWHIFNTLLNTSNIEDVYISCSSMDILKYIPKGLNFHQRPSKLDSDETLIDEVIRNFVENVYSDIYIMAHTTSPFLKTTSILNALMRVLSDQNDSALSVTKIKSFVWYNNSPLNYDLNKIPKTQDLEPIYVETSGFFIFTRESYLKNNSRIGLNPYFQELSHIESIDIDEEEDYKFALSIL
jgi:CMP-N-acetylneuraminic acid synthetase